MDGQHFFIGTDPGTQGASVILNEAGGVVSSIRLSKCTDQEISHYYEVFADDIYMGVVEKVHAMPKQGVSSTFKFGKAAGKLLMLHVALRIRYEEVKPRDWQKFLGIKKKQDNESNTDFKRRLKQEAQRLFPDEYIVNENADAFLIAEFARRKFGKNFAQ